MVIMLSGSLRQSWNYKITSQAFLVDHCWIILNWPTGKDSMDIRLLQTVLHHHLNYVLVSVSFTKILPTDVLFCLPQVPRAAIQGVVSPASAVHPAERRAHLQDQWDVHKRHQAVFMCGAVQERCLLCAWSLRALSLHLPYPAVPL